MRDDLKVRMPREILDRMGAAASPEAAKAEGVTIAREMLAHVRGQVQGVQVSAPFGKYKAAAQVLGLG
jgi:5,10-methylenetetrahydrofolate reductase